MENALIAGIATIVAAMAALFVEWMKSDAKLTSFPRATDDCLKASQFLEVWLKNYLQITALPDSEGKNLAKTYAENLLQEASTKLNDARSKATLSSAGYSARKLLFAAADVLRLRAPKRPLLWVPQLLFYAALAVTIRVVWVKPISSGSATCVAITLLLWAVCWSSEKLIHQTN